MSLSLKVIKDALGPCCAQVVNTNVTPVHVQQLTRRKYLKIKRGTQENGESRSKKQNTIITSKIGRVLYLLP